MMILRDHGNDRADAADRILAAIRAEGAARRAENAPARVGEPSAAMVEAACDAYHAALAHPESPVYGHETRRGLAAALRAALAAQEGAGDHAA